MNETKQKYQLIRTDKIKHTTKKLVYYFTMQQIQENTNNKISNIKKEKSKKIIYN